MTPRITVQTYQDISALKVDKIIENHFISAIRYLKLWVSEYPC